MSLGKLGDRMFHSRIYTDPIKEGFLKFNYRIGVNAFILFVTVEARRNYSVCFDVSVW